MDTSAQRLEELARFPVLRPLLAANPALPDTILAQLSEAREVEVRRARVALNPNTSLQVLGRLAGEFPGEFLRNPVLPILHLTRPGFIKELPFLAWASLLRFEALAPSWFQQLKTDIKYQRNQSAIWKLVLLHVSQAGNASKALPLPATGKTSRSWSVILRDELRNDQKYAAGPGALDPQDELETFLLFALLFPHTVPMLKEQWGPGCPQCAASGRGRARFMHKHWRKNAHAPLPWRECPHTLPGCASSTHR